MIFSHDSEEKVDAGVQDAVQPEATSDRPKRAHLKLVK
jgi:hypothetical protein